MNTPPFIQQLDGLRHPFEMAMVEGGRFNMGDEFGDLWEACSPVHPVKVSSFGLGKFPVTQALWKAVLPGENPSRFPGEDRPVEQVSWEDIDERFLPALRSLTGIQYRLPTEAEWEYAARGGRFHADGYRYSGSDRLKEVGWFYDNSNGETKPVGLKRPNQLGIFDMNGNVWEWCSDWYADGFYRDCLDMGTVENPAGPGRGAYRVQRGGSWFDTAQYCRAAYRNDSTPADRWRGIGFRLAFSLQSDGSPVPAFL